jgi:hypothetical protein
MAAAPCSDRSSAVGRVVVSAYSHREKLGVNDVARASRALQVPRVAGSPTNQLTERGAKGERYDRRRRRHRAWRDP